MAHKIGDDVAEVLRAAICNGDRLTLQGQLDRKMYERVNKVLDISGFKWSRKGKDKCHLALKGSASETLAQALDDGQIVDPKKEWDFFETPADLADRMAEIVGLNQYDGDDFVLEPSAGHGRLALAAAKIVGQKRVVCYDVQSDCCAELHKLGFQAICCDFMKVEKENFDFGDGVALPRFISMNPPFSVGQDIAHCRHAYDILKIGGRMVCITGPGWQYNSAKKFVAFKEWFEALPSATVEDLPAGTFKDSGTNVRALLLVIDKEA